MTTNKGQKIYFRINDLAKKKHTTVKAVARKAGFKSPNTIYNYKYGQSPTNASLQAIAKALQTTTDYLEGKTDDPVPHNGIAITSTDLDKMIDNARSFDGKPMDDHDREVIKNMLKGYYIGKEG